VVIDVNLVVTFYSYMHAITPIAFYRLTSGANRDIFLSVITAVFVEALTCFMRYPPESSQMYTLIHSIRKIHKLLSTCISTK
jgi:hypothetical protein